MKHFLIQVSCLALAGCATTSYVEDGVVGDVDFSKPLYDTETGFFIGGEKEHAHRIQGHKYIIGGEQCPYYKVNPYEILICFNKEKTPILLRHHVDDELFLTTTKKLQASREMKVKDALTRADTRNFWTAFSTTLGAASMALGTVAQTYRENQPEYTLHPSRNRTEEKGITGRRIGDLVYFSDGTSAKTIGNYTYFSNGFTAVRAGKITYYSDGTSSYRNGNITYFSDGVVGTKYGNTTKYNNGIKVITQGDIIKLVQE